MMRSANPTLKASTFEQYRGVEQSATMTISGTVNKTFMLLLFLAASASFAWNLTGDWRATMAAEAQDGAAGNGPVPDHGHRARARHQDSERAPLDNAIACGVPG